MNLALALLACLSMSGVANAADWSLDVTTISKHLASPNGVELNELNFGVGVKLTGFERIHSRATTRSTLSLGTFTNSYGDQSQYAGIGRELELADRGARLRLGITAGLVTGYQGTRGQRGPQVGSSQVFALPYFELGTERSAARVGLLGNALTLQLTFRLGGAQ